MLKWIFSPFISFDKLSSGSISVSTFLQLNTVMQHLDAATLAFQVLPQLFLCLGVCILFSTTFGRLGGLFELQLMKLRA